MGLVGLAENPLSPLFQFPLRHLSLSFLHSVLCLYVSLELGLQYVLGFCSLSLYVPNMNRFDVSGDVDWSFGSFLFAFRDSFADKFSKHLTVSLTARFGACFSF